MLHFGSISLSENLTVNEFSKKWKTASLILKWLRCLENGADEDFSHPPNLSTHNKAFSGEVRSTWHCWQLDFYVVTPETVLFRLTWAIPLSLASLSFPGQSTSNNSDWGREDKNTPVTSTCLATSESGQEPEHGDEWSPDFLLASITQEPHKLLTCRYSAYIVDKVANFLGLSATCKCMGLFAHFRRHAISATVEKYLEIHSLSSETFLPQKAGLYPTRHDPEQSYQVFMLALLWGGCWAPYFQKCLSNDIILHSVNLCQFWRVSSAKN